MMNGFGFRHQLSLDVDCVCMVWAARTRRPQVDGYRKGIKGNSTIKLYDGVPDVRARTTSTSTQL